MRRRTTGHVRVLAVAAGLTALLAGCSADIAPGAAALDADGDVIVSVSQVEDVTAELEPAQLTARDVLFYEIAGPAVRGIAEREGALVSAEQVQRDVADGPAGLELSAEAAAVLASITTISALAQGGAQEEVLDRLRTLDPTINPRYGEWDGGVLPAALPIVDSPSPWILTPAEAPADGLGDVPAEVPEVPGEGADG